MVRVNPWIAHDPAASYIEQIPGRSLRGLGRLGRRQQTVEAVWKRVESGARIGQDSKRCTRPARCVRSPGRAPYALIAAISGPVPRNLIARFRL